jgi:hypothetical protein
VKKGIAPIFIVLALGLVVIGSFLFVLSTEMSQTKKILNTASKKFDEIESLRLDSRLTLKILDLYTENGIELELNLSKKDNKEKKRMKVINISKDFSFSEISDFLFKIAHIISKNRTQENYTIPCEVFSYEDNEKVIDCTRGNISDVEIGCIDLENINWNCTTHSKGKKDVFELLDPNVYKSLSSIPLIDAKYLGNKTIAGKNCENIGFYYNPVGVKKIAEIIDPNVTRFIPNMTVSICFEEEHGTLLEGLIETGSEEARAEGKILVEKIDYVNISDLEIPDELKSFIPL